MQSIKTKHHSITTQLQSRKKARTNLHHFNSSTELQNLYGKYLEADHLKKQTKLLWKMFKLCYKNHSCQEKLAKLLNLPFTSGPISINAIPSNLLDHDGKVRRGEDQISQLQFLLQYLKNVKEQYFCWIIYYNQQLQVLNIKLFRQDQLQQNEQLFNPNINLIGLFVQEPKVQKTTVQVNQIKQFYSGEAQQNAYLSKQTTSHSTGLTWQQTINKNSQQNKLKSSSKLRKNKIRMRSISPKIKIISCSQQKKLASQTPQTVKKSKTRSFLSRQAKSKSNSQLLTIQQMNKHDPQSNKPQQYLKPKYTASKHNFKKKTKIQLYESMYGKH